MHVNTSINTIIKINAGMHTISILIIALILVPGNKLHLDAPPPRLIIIRINIWQCAIQRRAESWVFDENAGGSKTFGAHTGLPFAGNAPRGKTSRGACLELAMGFSRGNFPLDFPQEASRRDVVLSFVGCTSGSLWQVCRSLG